MDRRPVDWATLDRMGSSQRSCTSRGPSPASCPAVAWCSNWKSGWGAGTGWVDSQSILLTRGNMRIGLSILTHNDPDHTYGQNTLRGIAGRLLKGLNRHSSVK